MASGPIHYICRMRQAPYLVGIAGGSGSGKTTLIRALRESLPDAAISLISQDDYYLPKEEQHVDANGKVNFDLPTAVDLDGLVEDVDRLLAGESILRPEYTFNQAGMEPSWVEVQPAPVILVEGLFVLHHAPLRERFDLRVFVEASEACQLERRLERDARERGYGREEVMYQWENHVLPAYRNYLLPYRHDCDLHVVNEKDFRTALGVLRDHFKLRAARYQAEPLLYSV